MLQIYFYECLLTNEKLSTDDSGSNIGQAWRGTEYNMKTRVPHIWGMKGD